MRHREGRFTGDGKLELYYQCWHPAAEVKAVVGIVPGLGSHSGLFGSLVEGLVASGYGVYSVDLRGHGQSPGQRGHINRWAELCWDVGKFWQLMAAQNPGALCFLLGHSLGATVVLDYALRCSDALPGVVAIAPAIGPVGVSPIKMGIGRAFSRVWPRFSLDTGLPEEAGSRCPDWVAAYASDPLRHRQGTARLATEFLNTARRLRTELLTLQVPLLLLQGSEDSVVPPDGSRLLFGQLSLIDKEYREYSGGLHDLHNDICARQVSLDVVNWINRHVENKGLLCELSYHQ
ncbi:alpha/beta hydrolase [Pseudanabaena sp. FACHB-2040]|uniref:alpha/beta hydrolase n=1 Tax=Pseudanabaena sp. FACHB-2040 TaxID=2692859 RepID=UPI00168757F3|nr:alpha/beta hydrolase [Pseudanabaena sp. FACHB-2040]MBD2258454.1 lysophospholipase [Pseudanabaena sp. FACHB-2040]